MKHGAARGKRGREHFPFGRPLGIGSASAQAPSRGAECRGFSGQLPLSCAGLSDADADEGCEEVRNLACVAPRGSPRDTGGGGCVRALIASLWPPQLPAWGARRSPGRAHRRAVCRAAAYPLSRRHRSAPKEK